MAQTQTNHLRGGEVVMRIGRVLDIPKFAKITRIDAGNI